MTLANHQQPSGPGQVAVAAPAGGPMPGASATAMPSGMLVGYTPNAVASRAAALRSAMIKRAFSVGISILISVVYFLIFKPEVGSFLFWLLIGSVVYSVGLLGWAIVAWLWTRRLIAKVPLGPAFQIDTRGVVVSSNPMGQRLAWPQVRLIKGRSGWFNPGPRLEFAWDELQVWSVPIIMLDASPATIDSALRAFSLGRFGLDLSSVDEIW